MISGKNIGSMIAPIAKPLPGNRYRTVVDVANRPSMVAIMELTEAMIRLVPAALRNSSAAPSDLNQLNVNPDNGNEMMLLSLKAKIGKRSAGAFRGPP